MVRDENDIFFMGEALCEAKKAENIGEVPVGAIITKDGVVIARGFNRREKEQNALSHAEINAIAEACKNLKSWRLTDCTMYVTLEPCPMCAGAIINSRIQRLVYGAEDGEYGSMGSAIDLSKVWGMGSPKIKKGVLKKECEEIIKDFFDRLR